jgi:hypothetical protein
VRTSLLVVMLALAACDCDGRPHGGRPTGPTDRLRLDAGLDDDASFSDASIGDLGDTDATSDRDTGFDRDVGSHSDVGFDSDASASDSGASDSGADSDTGLDLDGGDPDTGVASDTGVAIDTGVVPDSGIGSGDLWIEIEYAGAFSPQSPSWSYSNTPGWTSSDWAFTGGGCCAEAWDRFNNMVVVDDPIGRALEIGPSSQLQLMFGIVRLTSYTSVTVELEGRSRATSSQVSFDVTNPANGCGVGNLTMDQDWTADTVLVDMTPCLEPGSMLQAIRVEPTGGSSTIALLRMRLTIYGAQF